MGANVKFRVGKRVPVARGSAFFSVPYTYQYSPLDLVFYNVASECSVPTHCAIICRAKFDERAEICLRRYPDRIGEAYNRNNACFRIKRMCEISSYLCSSAEFVISVLMLEASTTTNDILNY